MTWALKMQKCPYVSKGALSFWKRGATERSSGLEDFIRSSIAATSAGDTTGAMHELQSGSLPKRGFCSQPRVPRMGLTNSYPRIAEIQDVSVPSASHRCILWAR